MTNKGTDADEDAPALSDGTDVVTDFTIAETLPESLIRQLRSVLDALADGDETVIVDRERLDGALDGHVLTQHETEALFVGLSSNGAAEEVPTGRAYVNYDFRVDVPAARSVLDQQLVAATYREGRSRRHSSAVDLVATIPEPVDLSNADTVSYTGGRVRDLVLNANDTVRLANPYFDADRPIVDDLASLPRRGVDTRLLTRETSDPEADLVEALNTLFHGLSERGRSRLEVRDLYECDTTTGHQQLATHAKLIVIDDAYCYVGSANLTRHSLTRNFEFGLLLSGDEVAAVATIFDDVFEYADPVDLPLTES